MHSNYRFKTIMQNEIFAVMGCRLVVTDVSGQPICLDCLALAARNDRLSQKVGNYKYTLRNIPEERRYHPAKYSSAWWHEMILHAGVLGLGFS
jgi:hypothetical protein